MAFKYSAIIIAAYIYTGIFCISALPIRLERQASDVGEDSTVKSALTAVRDIANFGLPRNTMGDFYNVCRLLDDAKALTQMNGTEIQNSQGFQDAAALEIFHIAKIFRKFSCYRLNRTSEWNLINEDGSCSDSALDLFCTKIKLVHETSSALDLLNVEPDECTWLDETLKKELDVPQEVKQSIYKMLICQFTL